MAVYLLDGTGGNDEMWAQTRELVHINTVHNVRATPCTQNPLGPSMGQQMLWSAKVLQAHPRSPAEYRSSSVISWCSVPSSP
mmetsp:Transcript_34772/g.98581  ORF Transcript_34772/g.98581 Transcript_34772/m.98581 type:complete len:82 (+) Transcript_34772:53-298(+)